MVQPPAIELRGLVRRFGERIVLREVSDDEDARRERFLGSPTIRIHGRDIEPGAAHRRDYGLKCRIYQTPHGLSGIPPEQWILDALNRTNG